MKYGMEIPAVQFPEKIVVHHAYTLQYNEEHEQADWVAYQLTKEETNKIYGRTNKFLPDPKVKTVSAEDEDYKGSGFDRGHLAPAADMGWSETAMEESFYYSNMSPQVQNFNRGIWKKLEELVRTWAIQNEEIYIVTGPVLREGLPSIGPNKVSIPEYYYKVILDDKLPDRKAIALLLPNAASKKPLPSFVVSIDKLEALTGIDFFPKLDKEDEIRMEHEVCISCWTWDAIQLNYPPAKEQKESPFQCKGIARSGERCTNRTQNPFGYCDHHALQLKDVKDEIFEERQHREDEGGASVQCSGFTKSGRRCSRMTKNASGRCYQHD
jgi:endonuclease G